MWKIKVIDKWKSWFKIWLDFVYRIGMIFCVKVVVGFWDVYFYMKGYLKKWNLLVWFEIGIELKMLFVVKMWLVVIYLKLKYYLVFFS